MGSQSGKLTAAGEHQSRLGSTAGLYDPFAEESTDVLRRRAENLLDEMMLGTADIGGDYAADFTGSAGYTNGVFAPLDNGADGPAAHATDAHHDTANSGAARYDDAAPPASPPARAANGYGAEPPASAPASPLYSPASESLTRGVSAGGAGESQPRLVSAADRYAAVEAAARPRSDGDGPVNGAVRRYAASPASTMTVGARASLRSNLLPRSSEVDATAAEHEIDALLHEVAATLPPGHEATERSRHLLNKAQTILHSDQSRSAEIEYYLQQVRRILERTRQRRAWSELYRTRLWTYLVSWTLLAVVVMAGIGLYRSEFTRLLADFAGVAPEAIWVRFAGMTLLTACAGALGAILGVFMGIARRQRIEFGYFDRKYGLRGLLMPIFGFFFGVLIAAGAAALFYLLGVAPDQSALILIPIVIAFFVGVGQESLYGAR